MLPPFDDRGYLPPGVHRCSVDEVAERFGRGSPERQVEMSELRDFLEHCGRAGAKRALINGSFTTAKESPNDVDVVIWLAVGISTHDRTIFDETMRWPFLHIQVAPDEDVYRFWGTQHFATDRHEQPKGIVEVWL